MSTPNFSYENRCIVITDEDFENYNIPPYDRESDGSRNYPSFRIDIEKLGFEPLRMFDCVITSGYYTGACIDYVTPCDTIVSNAIEYAMYDDISVDEIFAQLQAEYNISRYRFNKCFGLRNPLTTNLWDYIENGCDKLQEWLCDQERSKADEILNEIKKMYGYDEYYCAGVFSNGEAIYYKK